MRVTTVHRRDTGRSETRSPTCDDYACQIRIACDDLHDDPYDVTARATILELLEEGVPAGPALGTRQG